MLSICIRPKWTLAGDVLDISIESMYVQSVKEMLCDAELHNSFAHLITSIDETHLALEHYEITVRFSMGSSFEGTSLALSCKNTDNSTTSSVYCTKAFIHIKENMETVIECKSIVDNHEFTVGFFSLGFLS